MRATLALLFPLVVVIALTPAAAFADEPAPAGPPYSQIHDALGPLAPAAAQVAAALATLDQSLVEAMISAGSQSDSLAPVIQQAAAALARFRAAAEESFGGAAPVLDLLAAGSETGAAEIATATHALDAAIRERAATLETTYGSLGPALSALCQANAQAPLLISLLPYGFAVGGLFDPLTGACSDVPAPAAPPTESLDPALVQYAALLEGASYALEPLAGILQPAFEPACTALVLVQTAGIFVTLPISTAPVVGPALSATCGIGTGTSPLSPAVVFVTVASQPFVPLAEDLAGSAAVLVPAVAPLRPALDPAVAGACGTIPATGQLGPLLPVPVPVEPAVFIGAGSVLLCTVAELPVLPGGDEGTDSGGGVVRGPEASPPFPGAIPFVPGVPTLDGGAPVSGVPAPLAGPPLVARGATSIGGLSPRVWAPLLPIVLLLAFGVAWMRWNRAMTRLGATSR